MNSVQVAVRCSKGEPSLHHELHVGGLRSDSRKGSTLREVLDQRVSKVFRRPFQEGNAGHVVGPFDGKKGHVELYADWEGCRRCFSCRRGDMNPMDTRGSEEACAEHSDAAAMGMVSWHAQFAFV